MPRIRSSLLLVALLLMAAGPPGRIPPGPLGDRDVTVLNRGPRDIVELYVSPSSADAWGADRLGDKTLEQGAKVALALGRLRDCGFDLLAVYDDASSEQVSAVNLCRNRQLVLNGSQITPPPLPEQHMTLVNARTQPIQQLYIAPPDAAQWGVDLLAAAGVSVGEDRKITFNGPCEADVRVVFANRAAEERHGLNLCRAPSLRITPGWTTEDPPN